MLFLFLFFGLLTLVNSCREKVEYHELEVTATAYNTVKNQTQGDPFVAAWGDTLKPGMKAIAVSRDLIDSGLVHMTPVIIEGLEGEYIVRDKMNARWRNKIDIYMEDSVQKAREWGKQEVTIRWKPEKE